MAGSAWTGGLIEANAVDDRGHSWVQELPGGMYALAGGTDRVYVDVNDGDEPGLYALSATDGTVDWSTTVTTDSVGRPVVAGESVLVRTGERLRCFDPADGSERWSRPSTDVGERIVVADDVVFTTRGNAVRAFR